MSDTFMECGRILGQVCATLGALPLEQIENELHDTETQIKAMVGTTAYLNNRDSQVIDAEFAVITAAKRLARAGQALAVLQSE